MFGKRAPIEMLWMSCHHSKGKSDMPPVWQNCLCIQELAPAISSEGRLPKHLMQTKRRASEFTKKVRISVVTSLHQRHGSHHVTYMREQLQACGHQVAFLQETRARESHCVASNTHFRIVSQANSGRGGTEIWLLRSDPQSGKENFLKKEVHVLFSTPEVLILKARFRGSDFLFFSAHSPHSGSDAHVLHLFWDTLARELRQWTAIIPNFIGGIDANAHFDVECEPHIGSHGLEARQNVAGDLLLSLMQQINAYAPSTYETCHQGSTATWTSNVNGAEARCDYVLLPVSWKTGKHATYPQPYIDAGNAGTDHTPLACDTTIFLQAKHQYSLWAGFDRKKLQRATAADLSRIFDDPPQVEWTTSVDEHATQLTDWASHKLAEVFPINGVRPRKGYIQDETWTIRSHRLRSRQALRNKKQELALCSLKEAWRAWKHGCKLDDKRILKPALQTLMIIRSLGKQVAHLTKGLTVALKHDRTASLIDLAAKAMRMSQTEFHEALKQLGIQSRKKPSMMFPLPIVHDVNGSPIHTTEQLAERWRVYFSEQEDGIAITPQELLVRTATRPAIPAVIPTWDQLPTAIEVEAAFRRTATHKAFFEDQIPGDLLAAIPQQMAKIFYPLLLKQSVFQQEATLYKGGRLVPAYKRGDPADCSNYRSLFVSSVVGKSLHRIYRQELHSVMEATRLPMQLGGLRGHSITQASHCLHLFQRVGMKQKNSVAFLFIDVQNAFYRLVRRHITPDLNDKRSARELFENLALPEGSYEEFEEHLESRTAMEEANADPFLQSLLAEFYNCTWYTVVGSPVWTLTRRGSRPGDNFADIAFGFALSKILRGLEHELLHVFPYLNMQWSGVNSPFPKPDQSATVGPLLPIWADDIALAAMHSSAEQLWADIPRISAMVLHRLSSAGLRPNMKRGKTELLLDVRGQHSLNIKRAIEMHENQIILQTPLVEEPLQITQRYKHLGTVIALNGNIAPDLRQKFAAAHDTISKYKAQLFCNRGLPVHKKVQLLDSLVLSVITFNSATWQPCNKRQRAHVVAGFHKIYKRVATMHFGKIAVDWSAAKLKAMLQVPDGQDILRVSRLRYLGQLIRTGQNHTWALIQQEQSWYAQIQDDLLWLRSFSGDPSVPDGQAETWDELHRWTMHEPRSWKSIIKRASKRATAYATRQHEWREWHAWIFRYLQENGAIQTAQLGERTAQHFCLLCKKKFGGKAAQAVHAFKKHERHHPVRYHVTGRQCECCRRQYSTHVNLLNHVRYSVRCFDFYQTKIFIIEPEPGVNSRRAQDEQNVHRPFYQAEGPREETKASWTGDPHVNKERVKLQEGWKQDCTTPHLQQQALIEKLKTTACQTYLTPSEIIDIFQEWLQSGVLEQLDFPLYLLPALHQFQERFDFEWLLNEEEASNGLRRWQHICMQPFAFHVTRQPMYRPKMFAHLFSGRRRPGDLQSCLERRNIRAISIDIIFHATLGDLCRPETFLLFCRAMEQGVLSGFLGGPPCETWSKARNVELEDGSRGPRVVRTLAAPWGKTDLTAAEDQQTTFGNRLLGVALKMFVVALVTGAVGILEHPAEDENDQFLVSIWRTALLRTLMLFPQCRVHRVLQGHFGSPAVKPTFFMMVHVTEKCEEILLQSRTTKLPTRGVIGRDHERKFRTAVLKEYPPLMCDTLAEIISESLLGPERSEPIPEWFSTVVDSLVAEFNDDAEMGADYARRP